MRRNSIARTVEWQQNGLWHTAMFNSDGRCLSHGVFHVGVVC